MSTVPLADLASVLLALPRDLGLEAACVEAGTIVLALHARSASARCPTCHGVATRVHSHYARTPADLAAGGVPVRLRVTVRRFRCGATCPRRLFAERLPPAPAPPALRAPHAHHARAHLSAPGS